MGVSSESGGLLQIRVTPAFMLTNAHAETATFEIRDGMLHAEWEGVRSQFDAATGRLILCECTSENGDTISISIRQNGVAESMTACVGQARMTQLNHGQLPALALGEFFTAETAWWARRLGNDTESTRWEALSRLLRNYDATNDVETVAFITSDEDEDEERFHIPASQALAANPLSWVGQCVLMGNTALLSRGSPAWQVGREAVAAMILGDATAFAELERLSRDETCGPLTSLYAAELLRFVHPALEKAWADRGLLRLDAVSLSNDLNQLTTDTPLGDFLAELVRELDRLPEAELQAVFAGIGDEWVSHAITIVTESSVRPETRVQQLVQLFWMAGLKDRVQDRLADHLRSEMETTQRYLNGENQNANRLTPRLLSVRIRRKSIASAMRYLSRTPLEDQKVAPLLAFWICVPAIGMSLVLVQSAFALKLWRNKSDDENKREQVREQEREQLVRGYLRIQRLIDLRVETQHERRAVIAVVHSSMHCGPKKWEHGSRMI